LKLHHDYLVVLRFSSAKKIEHNLPDPNKFASIQAISAVRSETKQQAGALVRIFLDLTIEGHRQPRF